VLFWYKQTIDRHGWEWMEKFMQQEPHFVRGTQAPADGPAGGGRGEVGITRPELEPRGRRGATSEKKQLNRRKNGHLTRGVARAH